MTLESPYGLRFMMMLRATVARLRGLLRETTSEKHIKELLSSELRLKASRVSVLVLTKYAALIEAVVAARKLLLVLAIEIIRLSFFWVSKNGDCVANGFEGFNRSWCFVFVGMHLKCQLLVSFFDLCVCRFFGYAENFVIVLTPAENDQNVLKISSFLM
jgi:hypothetical protein